MKERPILFSGEMVRAILEGQKTQTRRVIVPQPMGAIPAVLRCPHGTPGERLWVRETWRVERAMDHLAPSQFDQHYPADYIASPEDWMHPAFAGQWRPSIFMPRWASRITLEITDVRVQRVQDISFDDAIAEGVFQSFDPQDGHGFRSEARNLYRDLWDRINAKRGFSWDFNPWVWALTFREVVCH